MLLATANPQVLTPERARDVDARMAAFNEISPALSVDVQEAWVARYKGPGNDFDAGEAIAVDGSGNVYVTGRSADPDFSTHYATVKYNSVGQQQWVARYHGSGNYHDAPTAIAIDNSGNVYVTGYSFGSDTDYDYATIKYSSTGQELWVGRYNGPNNGDDGAEGIAVDGSGNVYVTGVSRGANGFSDYVTIKYNSAGQELWVDRYYSRPGNYSDEAYAIAIDGSGNAYVTGASLFYNAASYDYGIIKYDSAGQRQWVARYNGTGNRDDYAVAIEVDNSGNVYVTGSSWTSESDYDYATIKYNAAGQQEWVARYNGPGNGSDYPRTVAIDNSGNVYVTGESTGLDTGFDYATVKYNFMGREQWVVRYDGRASLDDESDAIAVDDAGNVYVTGGSPGLGTDYDYATIKYDSSGQEQWIARYNGPGNSYDVATAIAVDHSQNVYVTGRSGAGSDLDYATIKYVQRATPTPTPTATPTVSPTPTSTATPSPLTRPRPTPRLRTTPPLRP